jgi:hypothetical protein
MAEAADIEKEKQEAKAKERNKWHEVLSDIVKNFPQYSSRVTFGANPVPDPFILEEQKERRASYYASVKANLEMLFYLTDDYFAEWKWFNEFIRANVGMDYPMLAVVAEARLRLARKVFGEDAAITEPAVKKRKTGKR